MGLSMMLHMPVLKTCTAMIFASSRRQAAGRRVTGGAYGALYRLSRKLICVSGHYDETDASSPELSLASCVRRGT